MAEKNSMATRGILRSRRSAAQLHALVGVEREIRSYDHAAAANISAIFAMPTDPTRKPSRPSRFADEIVSSESCWLPTIMRCRVRNVIWRR